MNAPSHHHEPTDRRPGDKPGAGGAHRTLVSRRGFLYGALGAGAVAAVGIGAAAYTSASSSTADDIRALDAPASALTTLNDLAALESADERVQLVSQCELPYGTLVWADDDEVAACLLPTETGSPLTQVALLYLGSGSTTTVLVRAASTDKRFEIYDARATSEGLVWTEANVMEGVWRVYAARLAGGAVDQPLLLEEGDDTWYTPTIAASGGRAFWQVQPKQAGEGLTSRLMTAPFGSASATQLYESARRMGTPPYCTGGTVTITPRLDMRTVYYQLTNLDAATGEIADKLVLPATMVPLEAGYGPTGFMFSLPAIYDLEGAVANLGTYTPVSRAQDGDYDNARWFDFARTPTAAPAWCGDLLVVKSSYSVCGVDLSEGAYFAIDVDDGADNYGDYLASTGSHGTFVTYANIDHTPVEGAATRACRVKVWAPL